jgi:hypothetical protein
MNWIGREWREGKVRPIPGNSPHDQLVSRWVSFAFWRICDDPLPATPFPQLQRTILRRSVCVYKAWRNLSGPMWFQSQNQTLGRDRAASRWSAPSPGSRTCREDHAPSHRPQMSSGRLFLDRVARQQSPSPLHRHPQTNMHSQQAQAKDDISTLPERRHFYFALTHFYFALTHLFLCYILCLPLVLVGPRQYLLKPTLEDDLAHFTTVLFSSFRLYFRDGGIQGLRRRHRVYLGNRDGS